uniref:Uncharacterized protein n=1 Tax=Oryza meridionalis TaxID=40149 RepID=A0A0E0BY15_9ORYZ
MVLRDREAQQLRGTVVRDRLGRADRECGTKPVPCGGSARPGGLRDQADARSVVRNGVAGWPRSRGMDPRDRANCFHALMGKRERGRSRATNPRDRAIPHADTPSRGSIPRDRGDPAAPFRAIERSRRDALWLGSALSVCVTEPVLCHCSAQPLRLSVPHHHAAYSFRSRVPNTRERKGQELCQFYYRREKKDTTAPLKFS